MLNKRKLTKPKIAKSTKKKIDYSNGKYYFVNNPHFTLMFQHLRPADKNKQEYFILRTDPSTCQLSPAAVVVFKCST